MMRYEPDYYDERMREDEDGSFVRCEDYNAIESKHAALLEAAKLLRDRIVLSQPEGESRFIADAAIQGNPIAKALLEGREP